MDQMDMGDINGYYRRQYPADDLHKVADMNEGANSGRVGPNSMDSPAMGGASSFDQMMLQSEKETQRRRSFHHSDCFNNTRSFCEDPRRSSMMDFGSGHVGQLEGFQFEPSSLPSQNRLQQFNNLALQRFENLRTRRQMSDETLALNTNFSTMAPQYGSIPTSSPYGQNIDSSDSMGFDMPENYIDNNMMIPLDFSGSPLEDECNSGMMPDVSFTNHNFSTHLSSSPIQQNISESISGRIEDPGGGVASICLGVQDTMEKPSNMRVSDQLPNLPFSHSQPVGLMSTTSTAAPLPGLPSPGVFQEADESKIIVNLDISTNVEGRPFQDVNEAGQRVIPQYKNAYSSSGFDMLGVLMRVATRPRPQINIGAVDMSCAFVVCDVQKHDVPIVYCSDVFERLTAYTKHEILGRNCRFLQAPDGKIQAGVKRKYVDDQSVFRIKNMIGQRQESQISVINYRKGGQPFMNLLTMIPITWDTDEIKYYVGFQVDLVEQPTSITNKNPDGSYSINYQRGLQLPRYVMPESQGHHNSELSQTVHRDDVSTVLTTFGSGESELSKRIWDKVLLENTDDVVHVLSLKGLFLYLSPSCRKVLEYDPTELVGTALSSVCHPSDIVPVTRELKDTSTGAAANVVFRIRRKHSGYTWFESHGSLHLEQGKGRKCIIMVGRERPVYALAKHDIVDVGGIGESELWTKMSTSGMFLFVSSNVRSLLDRQPEDMIGTSAQALMRAESKIQFGKMLELACTGVRATFKHDVQNRRGQTLQARTTLYPGDAAKGQKPTFFVAQTKLLKLSRTGCKKPSNLSPNTDQKPPSPISSASALAGGQASQTAPLQAAAEGITTQAGGCGLAIGNQHEALASEENVFDELKTTRSTSWQFELRQTEKQNRLLAEELQSLLSSKKKRKRRNGAGDLQKDCVNCHARDTPEWRRGPSGNRDLCNSCGLRWAKENGRVTPRTSSQQSDKESASPIRSNASIALSVLEQQTSKVVPPAPENKIPQNANASSHHAKMARMEAPATLGHGGGIPAKIEEGEEPGDASMEQAPS